MVRPTPPDASSLNDHIQKIHDDLFRRRKPESS